MPNKPVLPIPRSAVSIVLLFAFLQLGCASRSPGTTLLERLQGHWEGEGPGGSVSVTIQGTALHFYAREDLWYETRFDLPVGTEPQQLVATIEKSSANDAGEVVLALVVLDGEELTLATDGGSEAAPASVEEADSRYDLVRAPLSSKK